MATETPARAADQRPDPTIIVCALDGTEADDAVLDWAVDEAARAGDSLDLVHVVDTGMQFTAHEMLLGEAPSLARSLEAAGGAVLEQGAARAKARRPDVMVRSWLRFGSPAGVLVGQSASARLLVVGSRPRGRFERVVMGSVALGCVHHAPAAVVVVPVGTEACIPRHVVVGVDGSPPSHRAADLALSVAAGADASVHCVVGWSVEVVDGAVVTEPGTPAWAAVERRYAGVARRSLEDAVARLPDVDVSVDVRHAEPSRAVLEAAAEVRADLVIVGSRGFGGFRGLLLGSVAKRVLEGADTVVAVVK